MLHDQDLPMFLWEEACNTTIYLQNKNTPRVFGQVTPEEGFTGKRPYVAHFRIFGNMVYCHVPIEHRSKLEPTTNKGTFVGYNETSKAYKIYVPTLRKTTILKDVKFQEERAMRNFVDNEQVSVQEEEQYAPRKEA